MIAAAGNQSEPENPQGVRGEVLTDPHHTRADIVLIRRAIREDWPVDSEARRVVVERMKKILENPLSDDELAMKASGVLLAADTNNIKRESLDQKDEHHAEGETVRHEHAITDERRSRLADLDARLGAGVLAIEQAASNGSGHPSANGRASDANGANGAKPT